MLVRRLFISLLVRVLGGVGLIFLVNTMCLSQIQLLNDEFNDANTLSNWKNINEYEGWNITQLESYNVDDSTEGNLFLKPYTQGWFGEYKGAYLFKFISGNFVLTTEVYATGRDGQNLPATDFSLAGLMVREPLDYPNQDASLDWQAGEQNYIFMAIGQASGPGYDFEIKNTCNSLSCVDIVPINTNRSKIRMARIGNTVIVLSRLPGGNWQIRNRYNRFGAQCGAMANNCNAPFSDRLQIGIVAYTDWNKIQTLSTAYHNSNTLHPDSLNAPDPSPLQPFMPDIVADYDYARFDSIRVPLNLAGLDLTNPAMVSDAELLAFLGYDTEPYCPITFNIEDDISANYLRVLAAQTINASSVIAGQANVLFGADSEVLLSTGFEVSNNSVFQIVIEGCKE